MQAPMPPPSAPASPYQPPATSMVKGNMYTFQKWLMIGVILLVFASVFAQFPFASSAPDVTDYDLADEKEANDYKEAVDSYEGQISLFGAMSSVLQTGALCLLAYAFVREGQEENAQHPAVRITMLLVAMILITSIVGRSFSLF